MNRRWLLPVLAAAAATVVVIGGVFALTGDDGRDTPPAAQEPTVGTDSPSPSESPSGEPQTACPTNAEVGLAQVKPAAEAAVLSLLLSRSAVWLSRVCSRCRGGTRPWEQSASARCSPGSAQ